MQGWPKKPTTKEITKILKGVQNGNIASLETILTNYGDFHWSKICYDKTGDTILHFAARLGHVEVINYLLSNFSPKAVDCKNKDDKTALHEASQFSQYECCKILLEHGANVNALKRADWTPLMLACTRINENSWKTVNLLLTNGSIVNYKNKDDWTCLHLVSREGDDTILKLLMKYGLKMKVKTKNGRTALHVAALHGSSKVIEVLLDSGCGVNETDNCGNTPLHEAVLGNNIDIIETLINFGADIYAKNKSDYSLVHLAASEGYLDVIKFILERLKLDVNDVNKLGLTPLHCAVRKNQRETYEILVRYGASEIVRDNFGRKPSDYFQ